MGQVRPCRVHDLFGCVTQHVAKRLIDLYPAFIRAVGSHAKHGALEISPKMLLVGTESFQGVTALSFTIKVVEGERDILGQFVEKLSHFTVEKVLHLVINRQNPKRLAIPLDGEIGRR